MSDLDDEEKGWVEAVVPVLDGIRKRRDDPEEGLRVIEDEFSVPGGPPRYVNLLKGLYDELADPEREWEYSFKPGETSPADVINYLESRVRKVEKGIPADALKAIYLMVRASKIDWNWKQFVSTARHKLKEVIPEKKEEDGSDGVPLGHYAFLVGTLLILAERSRRSSSAASALEDFGSRGDLFIAMQQARHHSPAHGSCILAVLYLNRERGKASLSYDPLATPQEFQSSTREGAYRQGREQYLSDIEDPVELDDALYHASVLVKQAGIDISDEMNHPDHDHSSLLERLRQKMTDPQADLDSADS